MFFFLSIIFVSSQKEKNTSCSLTKPKILFQNDQEPTSHVLESRVEGIKQEGSFFIQEGSDALQSWWAKPS